MCYLLVAPQRRKNKKQCSAESGISSHAAPHLHDLEIAPLFVMGIPYDSRRA